MKKIAKQACPSLEQILEKNLYSLEKCPHLESVKHRKVIIKILILLEMQGVILTEDAWGEGKKELATPSSF